MNKVTLAHAKEHLEDLIAQAEAGEAVSILRDGREVARLTAAGPRRPISLSELKAVTDPMPEQPETAADLVRRMRDEARY
ncbi:type II toxin-antitoxin system Phd/YefM family antitoxin [Caenispirillum bisanense]|uniref:Antitoxin component of toxin-antitoxin stability system, DNA-binding transcriptional repressor n=1 Tax=Caenispirillum bisanense TaxID=414052 RepID=A0A286G797_9PROT|nr:type II toxin-antitoxin system Phd/YefM family antitoxin [Caenispirillum bisanense]SOD91086.1 Antitoxin component of toxin-antitoxin stability system, DNA-binding transcriptional repressor [Caenispirillum bisanense]